MAIRLDELPGATIEPLLPVPEGTTFKSMRLDDALALESPELEKQRKRGLINDVKFFLGEGIVKSLAISTELFPAGAEALLQTGLNKVKAMAQQDLADMGVVFGRPEEEFRKLQASPLQQMRIASNNFLIENADKAIETSKRLQTKWVDATQIGKEAHTEEFLRSSPIPFTKNFSMTRMIALGVQSVPMLGLAAAVTAATKSPIAGASVIGVIQAAEEHGIALDKGLSQKDANGVFLANAVMLSALETIPLTSFMKGGKLPVRMFRTAFQEGGEEVLQQVWVNSVAQLGYDDTRKITEGMAENFIGGFISGGFIGGFGPGEAHNKLMKKAKDRGVDTDAMQEAIAGQIITAADDITDSFLAKGSIEAVIAEENFDPQRSIFKSLAQQLKEKQFDPVETALKEAIAPLPQAELTKEELVEITVRQREGGVKFEEGKPVPERQLVKEITSTKEFKEADREKQTELLIKGRTAALDVQRTSIEKQMTALEKDISKTKDKKVIAAKTKQLVKLSKQLSSIHFQLSDIVDSTAEELAREKILLPGETLETLRGKARDVGGKIAREEVTTVFRNAKAQAAERRTALVKFLQARLPGPENAKLREKFLLRAAKDMTEVKLQKMLTEIENLRETVRSKQLRERAGEILDRMRPKIVKGVKTGVFAKNEPLQTIANEIVRVAELSAPAVEQELDDLYAQIVKLNEAEQGSSEAAQTLKQQAELISSIGGLEQRGADDMETAIRSLSKQLANLFTGRDTVKELRKAQWKVEEASAVANIEKSEWKPNMLLRPLKVVGSVFRTLYQFSSFNLESFWHDLGLDKMVAEPLHKITRSNAALQQHFDRPVRQALADIYDVSKTSTRKYMKFLTERMSLKDSDNPDTRPFIRKITLNNGETKEFKMSRWDVMYWYAAAYQEAGVQDAEAYEILTGENELAAIREQAELEVGDKGKASPEQDIEDLTKILDMMSFAEPNLLIDDGEGGKTRLAGGHIAPFLKGMRTNQVSAILTNLESGKALTEIQQSLLEELLAGYRSQVLGVEAGTENTPGAEDLVAERKAKIKGNAIPAVSLEDMFADLTDQDRQFALEMRKIFTSFWDVINPTFARATGVNMTQIASFIPWIRKTASRKTVEELFTQYAMVEGHVTPFPSSTKERRATSTAPFAQTSLMDVHMGFRDNMSHWVATHDITARMQRYLKNDVIRASINRVTGGIQLPNGKWIDSAALRLMDFHLKGIVSRGRSDQIIRIPFMDAMRRNLTRYFLVKPKQFLLQITSAFTAIQQIGFVDFVAGVSSFIRDPKGANDLMSKALSMHNRYDNFSIEMKELGLRAQNEKKVKLNFFDKYALTFTKLGNRSGINLGGWAVFRSEFNKTKDIDKAFKAFDSFVVNTQQSAVREQQSAITVGPARLLFQFVSAVGQYGRIYYGSWSDLMKNPKSKNNIKQWARTMVIFHGLIPAARWAISQIGLPAPEEEEQEEKRRNQLLRMMMMGPFNGLWLLGDMASLAAHIVTGEEGFDTGPAVISQINRTKDTLAEAIREAIDDESDPDEILNSLLKAGKETAGIAAGVPGPASDMIRAMFLHAQGEFDPNDVLGILYGQSIDMINFHRGEF